MADPATWILRRGLPQAPPERVELRAGPLSMEYGQADLRWVRLGDREVLRRVYFAVRDRHWGTAPFEVEDLCVEARDRSFKVTFRAVHELDDVRFAWRGTIGGGEDGTVEFRAEGRALSTFLSNRIGLCVLHPIRECAGVPCTIEHVDGTTTEGGFPRWVSPHQPFTDMRAITHGVRPGVRARVALDGDAFEMEDQRNWTDQSFKTYSTPLRLPIPVEVREGAAVRQALTITLEGEPPGTARRPDELRLQVAEGAAGRLPAIGLCAGRNGEPLTLEAQARLRALALSHLRVDVCPAAPDWEDTFSRACRQAEALDVALEVALSLSDDADGELDSVQRACEEAMPRVDRWLVFASSGPTPSPDLVAFARGRLTGAPIGGGTDGYFAELNRNRDAIEGADLACFSVNPQVHAFDDASAMEALEGQRAVVESARHLAGGVPVAVTPVTLRPRFNPHSGRDEPGPDGRPFSVDPRQRSLFGAAWTLGSLKNLSEAGAASVTYYESVGPRGVMDGAGVFPLYHVLADVAEFGGADVVPVACGRPLDVQALALRMGDRTRVLIANLTAREQSPGLAALAPSARIRYLDETNAGAAAADPEGFRRMPGHCEATSDGVLRLRLRPYAVARVDLSGGPMR